MREVGRRREFEDELPARRIPASELLERVADVAAEDDRAFVGLHDDDLMSGRVPRRRQQPDAGQDLRRAVVLDVRRPRKIDPLPHRVVVLRPRVRELAPLDVNRDAREEPVPAAIVEVEVRVDDDRDATHELVRKRVRAPLLAVVFDRRRRVDQPRVDKNEPLRMLDRLAEPGQAVTGKDHFARQVPTDIVAAEHARDSFPGGLLRPHVALDHGG
jgi:hypothetical protein